jgi:group I intron endonuclease
LAWNKYGYENFKLEVVELTKIEDLLLKEQYWINELKSNNRLFGYNYCEVAGTTLGFKHTEETKLKMKNSHKGRHEGINNNFYGKKHTKEVIDRIKNGFRPFKGKHLPEDTRRKISESRTGEKNWMYGKKMPDHLRELHSKRQQGEKSHNAKINKSEALLIKYLCGEGV